MDEKVEKWRLVETNQWTGKLEWKGCEPVLMSSIIDRFYSGLSIPNCMLMPTWKQLSDLQCELKMASKEDILILYPLLCFRDAAWDKILKYGHRLVVLLASKLPQEKVGRLIEIQEMDPQDILRGGLIFSSEVLVRALENFRPSPLDWKSTDDVLRQVLFNRTWSNDEDRAKIIKASLHVMSVERWESFLRSNPPNELYRTFVWAYKWGIPFEIYDFSREDFMFRSESRCRQVMDDVRWCITSSIESSGVASLLLKFVLPEWPLSK